MSIRPSTIQFSNYEFSVNEDGTPVKAITLTRSNESDGEISVILTPSDGTAVAQNDYNNTPITITFAAGETSKTVTIPIINDTRFELDETVNLTLSNPQGGAILGNQTTAILTILESITPALEIANSELDFSGVQGQNNWYYGYYDGPFNSSDFQQMPQFNGSWWIENGIYWTSLWATGGHPNGQNANGGRLPVQQWVVRRWVSEIDGVVDLSGSLQGGSTIGRIFVDGVENFSQIINGQTTNYNLRVAIQKGTSVDFVIDPQDNNDLDDSTLFTTKILSNIAPQHGVINLSNAQFIVNENATANINLVRTGGSDGEVSITLTPTDGTATAGSDYTNTPITVTFADGETSKTITIPIDDDTVYETTETVNLSLSNPTSGATLGTQNTATLTIVNDDYITTEDTAITINLASLIANDSGAEGDSLSITGISAVTNGTASISGGNLVFTPAANFNGTGVVTYTLSDGFTTTPGTLSIAVTPVNDAPSGADKTISIAEVSQSEVIFVDNFDLNSAGLNIVPQGWFLGNTGTVDTIGTGTIYDFIPGNGLYIDLDGTTNFPGLLTKSLTLEGGVTYTLRFDLAGSQRGSNDTVDVTFGSAAMRISRDSSDPFVRSMLAFTPSTSGTYQVSFLNQGNDNLDQGSDNLGALLDRVVVQSVQSVYAYSFTAADFGFSDLADAAGAAGANSLQSVILTSLPAKGTLRLSGADVSAGQEIAAADLSSLTYATPTNANGSAIASFTFQVRDNGGTANGGIDLDPTANTISINVTPINQPPAGSDKTITSLEDSVYSFSGADFGFTDPTDASRPTGPNSLQSVIITTLPAAGSLKLAGVAVTAAQEILAANLFSLTYTPPANANGNGVASFTFQVRDNGGTSGGGSDLDSTPNTITFSITPVNDAPSGTDKTISTMEGTAYSFTAADFGFSDPADAASASGANTLQSVILNSLPAAGTLQLGGAAVSAGQEIASASLGTLVYTPAANANGSVGAAWSGSGSVQSTQGLSAYGGFGNLHLKNDDTGASVLTLTGLGAHSQITLNFSLAIWDSVDANPGSYPYGDKLVVQLDNTDLINEAFGNYGTPDGLPIVPIGPGTALAPPQGDYGYSGWIDSARMVSISAAHTGSSAVFSFAFPNSEGGANEAFGLDNLSISINATPLSSAPAGTTVYTQNFESGSANGNTVSSFTFQVRDNGGTANGGIDLDPTANTIRFDVTPVNVITLAVAPAAIAEDGSSNLIYTFTRTGNLSNNLTVNYTVGGSATLGTDYTGIAATPATKSVTFAAGFATARVTVDPTADTDIEADETVALTLAAGTGYTIGTTAAVTGTIINDDPTSLAISPASISLNEGNSGTTVLTYTVTRSGLLTGNSSVDWILRGTGGSPVNASDFVGGVLPSDKLNFKADETSKTISIRVAGDKIVEPDETFSVTLSNPNSNVSITTATASGTIINDDTSLAISPAAISLNEGNSGTTAFTYTVTRSGLLTGNSSVDWSLGTTGSNQVNASDFVGGVLPSDTLNFAAGESSKTFSVQVAGDNIAETDEDFTIKLTNAGSASIATAAATGIILNDDFTSSLINGLGGAAGFGENTLVRSNNGSSQWISLANIFPGGIQIDNSVYYGFYVNNNGNIRFDNPSSDYNPFDIATSSAAIIAPFFADVDTRGGRTVTSPGGNSTGSNSVYWDIDEKNKEITVTWDDVGYYRLRNSPTNAFQVILKNIGGNALEIDFRYEDVNWLVGDLSGSTYARAGYSLGANNRFELSQSGTTAMSSLEDNSNVNVPGLFKFFPVVNQNSIISLAVNPSYVYEDGTPNMVYTFTRQGNLANALDVNFSVAGTASYGSDYSVAGARSFSGANGTIRFAANQQTAQLVVDPSADRVFEQNETVSISLASGSGYIIGSSSPATGTILNDDQAPILNISPANANTLEGNFGTTWQTFTVTRSGDLTSSSSVNYNVQAANNWTWNWWGGGWNPWGGFWNPWVRRWDGFWGNGLDRFDFAGANFPAGTVNFAAGQSTATISIPIQGDRAFEWSESYIVRLSNPGNAVLGLNSLAYGTIVNDDRPWFGGDIRVVTHDGLEYDFQNTGVYTLTKSIPEDLDTPPDLNVAAVLDWQDANRSVSIITALAFDFGGHHFYFSTGTAASFLLDSLAGGENLDDGTSMFIDTLTIDRNGNSYTFRSQDGESIQVTNHDTYFDVSYSLNPSRAGHLSGLMGNFDGDSSNDAQPSWTSSAVAVADSPFALFIGQEDVPVAEQAASPTTIADVPGEFRSAVLTILTDSNSDITRVDQVAMDAWFAGGGSTAGSTEAAINGLSTNPFVQNFIVFNNQVSVGLPSGTGGTSGNTPCFMAGTLIATPAGEREIQSLKPGDLVLTPEGPQFIKFLGRTTRKVEELINQDKMPVRISQDAFGPQLPVRDTYCTPSHAFVLDDCLVECRALADGYGVMKIEKWPDFVPIVFFSIELEEHQLVWANGLLTETYYSNWTSTGFSREAWDNYPTYLELYQESKPMNELPMSRIPFARQLPPRIRERFKLGSGLDASRQEMCLTL